MQPNGQAWLGKAPADRHALPFLVPAANTIASSFGKIINQNKVRRLRVI